MARNIVRFAIFFLVAHALYRFVPAYVRYQEFKDGVNETALFMKEKPDAEIVERVMELAAEYELPLERDYVQVRRENQRVYIEATYVQDIEWLPGYRRPKEFEVQAEAVVIEFVRKD